MNQRVLVPLDGSKLAECALSPLKNLFQCGYIGEVTLLNVIEIPSLDIAKGYDIDAIKDSRYKGVQKYFADLESQLGAEGIKVTTVILEGNAAKSIIDYVKKNAIDLIVIATHGYTGMKQLVLGSVALKVLHESRIPVLLIRPESI